MTVEQSINKQLFTDIFVTAFEGGSNYWAEVNSYEFEDQLSMKPSKTVALSESIANELWNNPDFSMTVYDSESDGDEILGEITHDSCQKAFKLMMETHSKHFSNMMSENYDAETADIFFQLATMGEVVFG